MHSPRPAPALALIALALAACGSSSQRAADDAGSPIEGGTSPVIKTLASSRTESGGIAVQGTNVYWVSSYPEDSNAGPDGTGYLLTVPSAGGAVTTLGTAAGPHAVAADATNVYWTTDNDDPNATTAGGLLRMTPRAGGATTTIATGLQMEVNRVALGPTGVYWLSTGGLSAGTILMQTPLGGGTAATIFSPPEGDQIQDFVVDATNLYWAELNSSVGKSAVVTVDIMKMPLAGGTPATLASGQPCNWSTPCTAVVVGSSSVFWSDDGGVESVPIAGGAATTLVPRQSVKPVAVDSGFVYLAAFGQQVPFAQLMKVPLSGGATTLLASLSQSLDFLTGVAIDGTSLYLATTENCVDSGGDPCAVVKKVTPK